MWMALIYLKDLFFVPADETFMQMGRSTRKTYFILICKKIFYNYRNNRMV